MLYADEILFLLQNIIAQKPHPFIYQIPPKGKEVPEALLYWSGDGCGSPGSRGLVAASDFMKSKGLPFSIHVLSQGGSYDLTREDAEAIKRNGHELSIEYCFCYYGKDHFDLEITNEESLAALYRVFRERYDVSTGCHGGYYAEEWGGWIEDMKWRMRCGGRADNTFMGLVPDDIDSNAPRLCFGHGTAYPYYDAPTPDRTNLLGPLIEQGTDPLAVTAEYCRTHDIEVFCSFRMNNQHDGAGWPQFLCTFKKENPECLAGTEEDPPPHGWWTAADYGCGKVRNLESAFIEELCRSHDIDGIELDFARHPPLFRSVAWGGNAGEEETAALTDFMRSVRTMARSIEEERSRPFLISVCPLDNNVGLNLDHGLDIRAWLEEDLIDLICSASRNMAPLSTLIGLGHRYDTPVYANVNRTANRYRRENPQHGRIEGYRGQALNAWRQGADGIRLFNLFPEDPDARCDNRVFEELGDPNLLARTPRRYSYDECGMIGPEGDVRQTHARFFPHRQLPVFGPWWPLAIPAHARCRLPLYITDVGEEDVPILLCVAPNGGSADAELRLNGVAVLDSGLPHGETSFVVAASTLREGYNTFEISTGDAAVVITDLIVDVGRERTEVLTHPVSRE